MNEFSYMKCKSHPLRSSLYDELHIRPFHDVSTPHQISHMAWRGPKQEQKQALLNIDSLCERFNLSPPDTQLNSLLIDFGSFSLQWESHVEFYSITVMHPGAVNDVPFARPAIECLPADWLSEQPGEVVAAFHLSIVDGQRAAGDENFSQEFDGHPVAISETANGDAVLYTAFHLHNDGFGRFIVRNINATDEQMGRLTRRLIEMETYRLFAMIAFPLAKQIAPQLVVMDRDLARILSELPRINTVEEERDLLLNLSRHESRLEIWRAETNHRFSGAKAYHEMIKERLSRISENKVTCNATLGEFMCRRLDPALRTCSSVHDMMEDLSRRIKQASELMRTRISLNLQDQNRVLLATMNRRSRLQLRLQETVEGFSVVAISYYLIGLIKYFLEGLPLKNWGLSKGVLLTMTIPLVLGIVFWLVRRIKHQLVRQTEQPFD